METHVKLFEALLCADVQDVYRAAATTVANLAKDKGSCYFLYYSKLHTVTKYHCPFLTPSTANNRNGGMKTFFSIFKNQSYNPWNQNTSYRAGYQKVWCNVKFDAKSGVCTVLNKSKCVKSLVRLLNSTNAQVVRESSRALKNIGSFCESANRCWFSPSFNFISICQWGMRCLFHRKRFTTWSNPKTPELENTAKLFKSRCDSLLQFEVCTIYSYSLSTGPIRVSIVIF